MNQFFSSETSQQILLNIQHSGLTFRYEQEKHRLCIEDRPGNEPIYFRLPLLLSPDYNDSSKLIDGVNYIILLIQSGSCAMGYFENGLNVDHKVFRAYMVRKKQGKSQIKYLKTKGKSRAGSRVRLGETVEFFENINNRLNQYFEDHEIHRIAISCSKTLIPYLFSAKVPTPFDKRDERLYRIPKHIHTPIYEVMMETNKFLQKGELIWEEDQGPLVEEVILKSVSRKGDT